MTTGQLASKAKLGFIVKINGMNKSYFQLANMKGKSYLVTIENEKTISTVNVQTLK